MNNLIPVAGTHAPEPRRDKSFERLHQRTRMGVARVEQQTVIDVAQVQRQVIVQSERISGVDSLTRDAMIDCALRDGLVGSWQARIQSCEKTCATSRTLRSWALVS